MPTYKGEHEKELIPFIDAMRYKLVNNKYRGQRRWEEDGIDAIMDRLRQEVEELAEAIRGGNTAEIMMEGADVGNFAMMVVTIAIRAASNGGLRTAEPYSLCYSCPEHGLVLPYPRQLGSEPICGVMKAVPAATWGDSAASEICGKRLTLMTTKTPGVHTEG